MLSVREAPEVYIKQYLGSFLSDVCLCENLSVGYDVKLLSSAIIQKNIGFLFNLFLVSTIGCPCAYHSIPYFHLRILFYMQLH